MGEPMTVDYTDEEIDEMLEIYLKLGLQEIERLNNGENFEVTTPTIMEEVSQTVQSMQKLETIEEDTESEEKEEIPIIE